METLKWLIAASLLFFFLHIFRRVIPIVLQFIGDYLVFRQEPESADCIVALSGERGERVIHAASLYHQGYASIMLMSGGPGEAGYPESQLMRSQAISLGVPSQCIITEERSISTYDNALLVKEIAIERGFRTLLLVTSPYHSRRAFMHFSRIFEGSEVRVISCPVKDSWFNPDHWWTRHAELERVILEYFSYLWHLLYRVRGILK